MQLLATEDDNANVTQLKDPNPPQLDLRFLQKEGFTLWPRRLTAEIRFRNFNIHVNLKHFLHTACSEIHQVLVLRSLMIVYKKLPEVAELHIIHH